MSTLYVSDLDGTLLNDKAQLSEKTRRVINSLTERNVLFTYATARSYSSASKITKGLNLNIPVITYNGTFFVDQNTGKVICANFFSQEIKQYIENKLEAFHCYPLVYSMINGMERVSYLENSHSKSEGLRNYLGDKTDDKRLRCVTSYEELYQGDIFYFTLIGPEKLLSTWKEGLESRFEQAEHTFRYTFQEEIYQRDEYWLEIMPGNATKAFGVKKLKETIGCDKVVCFGDALNDIPLFEIADECYAVQNAVAQLKERATDIIKSNYEDGVAKWLLENAD